MKNRKRGVQKNLYLSDQEWEIIKENMDRVGIQNFSSYARKVLCDGYVVKLDFSQLRTTIRDVGGIARNINQIAKRANETRNIYAVDVNELRNLYGLLKTEYCRFVMDSLKRILGEK